MFKLKYPRSGIWIVNTDGAIRPSQGISGLGAVARDSEGEIRYWWSEKTTELTCNEAEYAAAVMALEKMRNCGIRQVILLTDSKVMVDQIEGRSTVRANNLRGWYQKLRNIIHVFERVKFVHIPREQNRLADALANEAVDKRENYVFTL